MTLEDIMKTIKEDSRNEAYTKKGISPILQINETAEILIIGQAPGKKTEEAGIPFNDRSGENLIKWMGIDKKTFYSDKIAIMPMDFYYPGKAKTGDLPPRSFIAKEYHCQLLALMSHIKLIMLIGNYAIKYYLKDDRKKNLTETVRSYQEYLPEYFPLIHPSPLNFRWHIRNPWFESEVLPELQKRIREIV